MLSVPSVPGTALRALIPVLLLAGCATVAAPPMLVRPALSSASHDLPFHGNKVLVISPKLIYRDAYTEKELPPGYQKSVTLSEMMKPLGVARAVSVSDRESTQVITILMAAQAYQAVLRNGFEAHSFRGFLSSHPPEVQESSLSELEKGSENLLKAWSKDREYLLGQLRILKEFAGIDGVVLQTVNVKLGETAQWDSSTGRISAGTSSSALKVGLVETATGELVWERESFYRDVPNASNLDAMLKMLFQDFPLRKRDKQTPVEVKREF